jgi:hypothetical protein
MYRTLEAVEYVDGVAGYHLKNFVVVVTANFTFHHNLVRSGLRVQGERSKALATVVPSAGFGGWLTA